MTKPTWAKLRPNGKCARDFSEHLWNYIKEDMLSKGMNNYALSVCRPVIC